MDKSVYKLMQRGKEIARGTLRHISDKTELAESTLIVYRGTEQREKYERNVRSSALYRITEKECSKCYEYKLLTDEYFYGNKNNNDGYQNVCKECQKNYQKQYNEKRHEAQERLEQEEKEMMIQKETETFNKNKKYKVIPLRIDKRTVSERGKSFTGKPIYQNDRLLTLRSDIGIAETFLKIDFVIGDYKYEELS